MSPHEVRRTLCVPVTGSDFGGGGSGAFAQAAAPESTGTPARETASRPKSAPPTDRTKSSTGRFATEAKQTTADRISSYGSAMHNTAQSMEHEDPNIAWVTHQVADRVQGVADYLRTRDLSEVRSDAENFARRHPVAFFGGLFLAGLVAGSLLKAKPEQDQPRTGDRGGFGGNAGDAEGEPARL